jgi:hypothetical protein
MSCTLVQIMKRILVGILVILFLAGCAGNREALKSPAPVDPLVSQPSPVLFTPSPEPPTTPSPLPLPTKIVPTLIPTLSTEEKENRIQYWKRTNGDCPIPCIFGVFPKKTTLDEVRNIFNPVLGEGQEIKDKKGTITEFRTHFFNNNHYIADINMTLKSNVVKSIEILRYDLNDPTIPPNEWDAFSLPNILQKYGVPTNVEFFDQPHIGEGDSHPEGEVLGFDLFFQDHNTIVSYYGSWKTNHAIIPLCLGKGEAGFDRIIMGDVFTYRVTKGGVKISDAATITPEEFYKIYSKPTNQCFQLKTSAFSNY